MLNTKLSLSLLYRCRFDRTYIEVQLHVLKSTISEGISKPIVNYQLGGEKQMRNKAIQLLL